MELGMIMVQLLPNCWILLPAVRAQLNSQFLKTKIPRITTLPWEGGFPKHCLWELSLLRVQLLGSLLWVWGKITLLLMNLIDSTFGFGREMGRVIHLQLISLPTKITLPSGQRL